jgi:hypothetical protein
MLSGRRMAAWPHGRMAARHAMSRAIIGGNRSTSIVTVPFRIRPCPSLQSFHAAFFVEVVVQLEWNHLHDRAARARRDLVRNAHEFVGPRVNFLRIFLTAKPFEQNSV